MFTFANKIIYQIYPKSFKDSNGDGFGDLPGIVEKLDYLKDLGVDYLWITPFFPSPQRDNGYDIASYTEIDQRFGNMEDFEILVKEADKRDIGIMLDMVFNHTSTDHIWFQRALAGEKSIGITIFLKREIKKLPPQTGNRSLEAVPGNTVMRWENGIFTFLTGVRRILTGRIKRLGKNSKMWSDSGKIRELKDSDLM